MLSPAPNRSLLERLAAEFGLGRVEDCHTLRMGSSNALFRLTSAHRSVVLRRLARPPETVARQHALVRHLASEGFPALPPLESSAGKTMLAQGGATYVLYPLVAGRHPKPGDPHAAILAGRALARLHALTSDRPLPPPNLRAPMRERFLSSAGRFGARVEAVLADSTLAAVHADARWLGDRVQTLARALENPAYARLPTAVIHGDFNPENLILDGPSLVAVLDFDLATHDARVADLAVALHYLPREHRRGRLAGPVAARLLSAYEEISPLSVAERQALALLLEAKAARSAMRMLRHVVKAGPHRRRPLSTRLSSQLQGLRALDEDPRWRAVFE